MFIIGELINGMYKGVAKAIAAKDRAFIEKLAQDQVAAGADALDLNVGPGSRDQAHDLVWLVETVQAVTPVVLCLDSTKPQAIEAGLKVCKNPSLINSTSADDEKMAVYFPMAKQYRSGLIALTMDKNGVPQDKDRRLELAAYILEAASRHSFCVRDLYLDPILMPINVAQNQLFAILEVIKDFKLLASPAPKTVVGLSNISQGSQDRSLVNRTFCVMAQAYGLEAAILDPLDKDLMEALIAGEVILDKAIYCDSFVAAYKKSKRSS